MARRKSTPFHRRHRGRAVAVEGLGLRQIRSRLRRAVLDAEAEICFHMRRYAGRQSKTTMRVRIVGLWDESHSMYHWYITNLPAEIPAEEIGKFYSARAAVSGAEELLCARIDPQPQEPMWLRPLSMHLC